MARHHHPIPLKTLPGTYQTNCSEHNSQKNGAEYKFLFAMMGERLPLLGKLSDEIWIKADGIKSKGANITNTKTLGSS
jgi:hypothetical protein